MNGIKPNFLKESQLTSDYYKKPNPYMDASSCHVNLFEMSRSAEEVNNFSMLQKQLV